MRAALLLLTATMLAALGPISFPGGERGTGFDDLGFAPAIDRVLVPGGRTGTLMLIEPATQKAETIGGFSEQTEYGGGHGEGITSADEGRGFLFVTDRTSKRLDVVDPRTRKIVAYAPLGAGPDYVRFVADTGEVWVTEPSAVRIEVFSLAGGDTPKPARAGLIEVPGGPESLVIDNARGRAYTNLWGGASVAIELKQRKIAARWPNGCKGSRGIALDEKRGLLFVGCEEGRLSVIDVSSGKRLGQVSSGRGVDIIAYNSALAHAYLPGADSATMATIAVASDGAPTVIGTTPTARGAHCAAADNRGQVYVCDPLRGRILVFRDAP